MPAPHTTFVASFLGAPAMNLFPARVESDGTTRLDMAPDTPPDTPLHTGLRIAPGTSYTFGIRPEDLMVRPVGQPGLSARIDQIEDLGAAVSPIARWQKTMPRPYCLVKRITARARGFPSSRMPIMSMPFRHKQVCVCFRRAERRCGNR
ncbi:hypothetical protein GCM10010961_32060 [Pseudodonghicola xiamenensis]|uniref:MalK-like OB fold domain-containing protein n=1 Tax=Pseudodonghicola xiamenensis TaxID=337702 RepID=A0A8J3HB27_9RHOB|nr:hypothetical protein GCM10010961_32060 [Pseudodonghicola xiamenensis]